MSRQSFFAAVVASDVFISLTEPQTNTHKQTGMGDVFPWPHAEITDLMGPSYHSSWSEPHNSPASYSDMMDRHGLSRQKGSHTNGFCRERVACELL